MNATSQALDGAAFEVRPSSHPTPPDERARRMEEPGFGRIFTDHMVLVPWELGQGWGRGTVQAYAPLALDPAASVLHYGQAIFEGFKAYRQPDGGVSSFRPEQNALRFAASARRLAMPEVSEALFVGAADALIRQDEAWVPRKERQTLYIRPLMIATEPALGVRPANRYLFVVIAMVAGPYFPQGVKPVSVWVSDNYVRAVQGGTGMAKCAGNYAASLAGQAEAVAQGCSQVVWLDAIHRRYVEELGGMNIFFVYREKDRTVLVTPELTGALLPGVTRASILKLGPDLGYDVDERRVSLEEWRSGVAEGRITEAFACGTAAVVTPIGAVKTREGSFAINGGETGDVAARVRKALQDIQFGRAPDRYGWMHRVL